MATFHHFKFVVIFGRNTQLEHKPFN